MSKGRYEFKGPPQGKRSHAECKEVAGVFRPGKTAHDKATGAWQQGRANKEARRNYG